MLSFDESLIDSQIRVFENLENFREKRDPLYETTVRQDQKVVFACIRAAQQIGDEAGGILTVRRAGDRGFHLFQLNWGPAPARGQCGVPEPFEFVFVTPLTTFTTEEQDPFAWLAADEPGVRVDTVTSRPTEARCCSSGSQTLGWSWHVACRVQSLAADDGSAALQRAVLAAAPYSGQSFPPGPSGSGGAGHGFQLR